MEALLKSPTAMEILTTISLAQFLVVLVLLIGIGVACYKSRDIIKDYLEDYRKKANRKEEAANRINTLDKEIKELREYHDKDMEVFYSKQLGYRQQSLDKQASIEKHFNEIDNKIDSLIQAINEQRKEINAQHEETRDIKRNELRDKLLQMYRSYTSIELNPEQEWSEMEAEVFWELFKDYEKLGGNGFMHNTVKPAMQALKVVVI